MNEFETYDDFIDFINPFTPYRLVTRFNIPELITEDGLNNNFAFIVHLPKKVEWNNDIYHQAHVTWNQVGSGLTGQGSGSCVKFCWKEKVHDTILNLPSHFKYITILRVGMNFANFENKTPISYFFDDIIRWERGENDYWIKAHIIAKHQQPANLHDQHLILNREWWNKLGSPDLFKLNFLSYERSETNFHDDYTPHWLKPKDLPIIRNFPINERGLKVFSYNRLPKDPVTRKTGIPPKWWEFEKVRNGLKFYPVNTESFKSGRGALEHYCGEKLSKIETLVTPTAGLSSEHIARKYNIKHIVFYDITEQHLNYKKNIVDIINSAEELKWWVDQKLIDEKNWLNLSGATSKMDREDFVGVKKDFWYSKDNEQHDLLYGKKGELHVNGTIDEQLENLQWVRENCKVDYIKVNMMEDNYYLFQPYIKDKIVYFNMSNIYSYIRTHINYRFKYIINRFYSLETFLKKNTEDFILKGIHPNKTFYLSDKNKVLLNYKTDKKYRRHE